MADSRTNRSGPLPIHSYRAAGGVVVRDDRVLVLRRPELAETRLPKGHIEAGETAEMAALRESREESGYNQLQIRHDLGTQVVEFDLKGEHIVRQERYFLMELIDPDDKNAGERQFEPVWLSWMQAIEQLTFEAEREWVRRAKSCLRNK